MLLYLIRHGKAAGAAGYPSDAARPLTADGAEEMRRVARRLGKLGVRFDVVLSSPLVRARETAEIVAEAGIAGAVDQCGALAPGGTLDELLAEMGRRHAQGAERIGLVGHEPTLSQWAARLAGALALGLDLKKGGVIGLELPDRPPFEGRAALFWLTSPKLL
jgi:phosphohistidine phosphatase